jgi:hypothetical protein
LVSRDLILACLQQTIKSSLAWLQREEDGVTLAEVEKKKEEYIHTSLIYELRVWRNTANIVTKVCRVLVHILLSSPANHCISGSGIAPFFPVSNPGGNAPLLFPWRLVCRILTLTHPKSQYNNTDNHTVPLLLPHPFPALRRLRLVRNHPMDHPRNTPAQSKSLVHHRHPGHLVG